MDDLIESADDVLFKQIIAKPNYVLAYLLPDKTDVHCDFRPRRHYRQLIPKLFKLHDSNFIVRMLCKIPQITYFAIIITNIIVTHRNAR